MASDSTAAPGSPGTDGPHGLRLRGEVDGEERTFPLPAGVSLVGGAREAGIHLPVRGVSRRHARLELAGEALRVTDLGSKNGTFADEQPVDGGTVRPGQILRFGPVGLHLERVPVADTRLALEITAIDESGSTDELPGRGQLPEGETSLLTSAGGPAGLLDRVLIALGDSEPDADRFLAALVEGWSLTGAAILESGDSGESRSSWTVSASQGSRGDLPPLDVPGRRAPETGRPQVESGPASGSPRATWAVGPVPGGRLALVLWRGKGEQPPARPWLPVFWRLALWARPGRLVDLGSTGEGEAESGPADLDFPPGVLAGTAPPMKTLYRQMRTLVGGRLPVLILGETGVGKEHLAKTLHRSSTRRQGPFVAVNCAALPAELLEAELFGIGRGVATGVSPRPGRFLEADGGTVFLDEIGELAPALQAKLLRVLQEGEIHPLGLAPKAVDVRVISATNAAVQELIAGGAFRRDLFYRLAGDVLEVPPLRHREEDISRLVGYFLRRAAETRGRRVRGVTVKALQQLEAYTWPGNVRELEHEVRRLVSRALDGQVIDSEMLGPAIRGAAEEDEGAPVDPDDLDLGRRTEHLERELIQRALRRTAGNKSRAARLLGISRNGLANRISRYGLRPTPDVEPGS